MHSHFRRGNIVFPITVFLVRATDSINYQKWRKLYSCWLLQLFSHNILKTATSLAHKTKRSVKLKYNMIASCPEWIRTSIHVHIACINLLIRIDIITYHTLLTYAMVKIPSWETSWFAASQETPRISRNPKVHYRTHKRPPPVSILGQPNPVHIPTSHLPESHPNIIHPSTPRSPQWFPSLRFPHQDPIHPPLLTHTCHMPSPYIPYLHSLIYSFIHVFTYAHI